MKLIGNILWMIFGGLATALEYITASVILMMTIVGIPFGIATLRIGLYVLWPFGQKVVDKDTGMAHGCLDVAMNILWILTGGIFIWCTHILLGLLLCLTVIGIPFGRKQFTMARLALTPFGKQVVAE